MGMFSGILDNAAEADAEQIQKKFDEIFIPEEKVQAAFVLVRDTFIFTDKRLVLVNVRGTSGKNKKSEYLSIPYKSIRCFSVETAGNFNHNTELKVWLYGDHLPAVSKKIKEEKGIDIVSLQRTLAYFVMNS